MDDQPKSVKDLLVEAKDASELMVDLAYAAVFFNEDKLAREVERLEERMNGYLRRLREMAMLAARSPEDAEAMAGVLWIADAIEKIGDAASDIARVVEARLGIPDALRRDLRHADEMTARVKVREDAPVIGRALRELSLPTETGMWVMAIRSGIEWQFDPGPDDVLSRGRRPAGPRAGGRRQRCCASSPARPPLPEPPDDDAPPLSELDRAVDILVELKDQSEAAVGLAYSSLLFNNRALAAEVGALEARERHPARRARVVGAAGGARGPQPRRAAGAAPAGQRERVDVRRGAGPDVVRRARRAAAPGRPDGARGDRGDLGGDRGRTRDRRPTAGALKELRVETETGMFVLAVQRGPQVDLPAARTVQLRAGDRVIAVGPEEGAEELDALCRVAAATAP